MCPEKPGCCPDDRVFPAMVEPSEYKYKGEYITAENNLPVYKVGSGRNAIVVIADIFGLETGRHLGICDQFAENLGLTVVAPDLYRGERFIRGSGDLEAFVAKYPASILQKDLDILYKQVLPNDAYDKIFLIGFCWGSWLVYHEGARLIDPRIVCGVNLHPSLRLEGYFGGDTKSLSDRNQIPQLLFPCRNDPENLKPGEKCELQPNLTTIHVMDKVEHGFSSQGDITDPDVKSSCEEAFNITELYLKAHL